MIGRTNAGGGGSIGGGSLNFRIFGGTSAPSNPKENDIWVKTETKITGYSFSVKAPTAPVEGMVWVSVGTDSSIEFNAIKGNVIAVYPVSVKQYVGGAFGDKSAQTYQNGVWNEWRTYIYNSGDVCTDISGGWLAASVKDGHIYTFDSGSDSQTSYTKNKVPSSKYKKLCAECVCTNKFSSSNGSFTMQLKSTQSGSSGTVYATKATKTADCTLHEPIKIELDLSEVTVDAYVRLTCYYAAVQWTKIWFE